MRFIYLILFLLFIVTSCVIDMRNPRPPKPMKWFSFSVSGFQLNDIMDSVVNNDPDLFYDRFVKGNGNPYTGIFMSVGEDTIVFIVYVQGDCRNWLESSDSSHLALMDIRPGTPSPDSLTSVMRTDTLSLSEKLKFNDVFISRVLGPVKSRIASASSYSIRPLNQKDTLNAQWIMCKGKNNTLCDTFWLTSKNGGVWVIADSNIFVPYNYNYKN